MRHKFAKFSCYNCHKKTSVSNLINFQDEMVDLFFLQKEVQRNVSDKKFYPATKLCFQDVFNEPRYFERSSCRRHIRTNIIVRSN